MHHPIHSIQTLATAALLAVSMAVLTGPARAGDEPTPTPAQNEAAEREALFALVRRDRGPVKDESVVLNVAGHPSVGADEAPLVLLEFTDFDCPFCRRHLSTVLPRLLQEYVERGRLRYVFFDFPSETRHPAAFSAALAARCASDQHRYWEVHNWLFANHETSDRAGLLGHVRAIGIDVDAFKACLDRGQHAEAVRADLAKGVQLRVRGTPTFFLGRRGEAPGEVVVLRRITGAQPLELFQRELDTQLAAPAGPAPADQVACCK
jgi:protein-disulfide isomerase